MSECNECFFIFIIMHSVSFFFLKINAYTLLFVRVYMYVCIFIYLFIYSRRISACFEYYFCRDDDADNNNDDGDGDDDKVYIYINPNEKTKVQIRVCYIVHLAHIYILFLSPHWQGNHFNWSSSATSSTSMHI